MIYILFTPNPSCKKQIISMNLCCKAECMDNVPSLCRNTSTPIGGGIGNFNYVLNTEPKFQNTSADFFL